MDGHDHACTPGHGLKVRLQDLLGQGGFWIHHHRHQPGGLPMESIYTPRDNRDERSSAPIVVPEVGPSSQGPPCPTCGGPTKSKGRHWICRDITCGRWIMKYPKNLDTCGPVRKSTGLDVHCPHCSASEPYSNGPHWRCSNPDCGKKWKKGPHPE